MELEDTDNFWGTLCLIAVLVIDFQIVLSLLWASEYFSVSEVLWIVQSLPIKLLCTVWWLTLQVACRSFWLTVVHWEGSLSSPLLCFCTWAESCTSSSPGSSLKTTVVSTAFAVFLNAFLFFPAPFASVNLYEGLWARMQQPKPVILQHCSPWETCHLCSGGGLWSGSLLV